MYPLTCVHLGNRQQIRAMSRGFARTSTAYTLFNAAIEAAAPSFGMTVRLTPVHDDIAIEDAIAAEASEPGGGLICLPDSFIVTHRDVIIAAAAREFSILTRRSGQ